ncbi:sel1 repeat family protein [Acetobacteraceae bacterium]|nr:sel1 repeat family protein [Acetobacteraceae bacterium]
MKSSKHRFGEDGYDTLISMNVILEKTTRFLTVLAGCFGLLTGTMAFAIVPEELDGLVQKADQGDVSASYALGVAFLKGDGVPQNDSLAAQYFQKASNHGSALAENALGLLYEAGNGVPQNKEKATSLFQQAAAEGNQEARIHLELLQDQKKPMIVLRPSFSVSLPPQPTKVSKEKKSLALKQSSLEPVASSSKTEGISWMVQLFEFLLGGTVLFTLFKVFRRLFGRFFGGKKARKVSPPTSAYKIVSEFKGRM